MGTCGKLFPGGIAPKLIVMIFAAQALASGDQYARAYCIEYGLMIDENLDLALRLFEEVATNGPIEWRAHAAERRSVLSIFVEGAMESEGLWSLRAAKEGLMYSQHQCGIALRNGDMVEVDESLAAFYQLEAARQGDNDSMFHTAYLAFKRDCHIDGAHWLLRALAGGLLPVRECKELLMKRLSSIPVVDELTRAQLEEMYEYGRAMQTVPEIWPILRKEEWESKAVLVQLKRACDIFDRCRQRLQDAVNSLCVLYGRRCLFGIPRDVLKLIVCIVRESEHTPAIWSDEPIQDGIM